MLVTGRDVGVAHRQRRPSGLHSAETLTPASELTQQVDVDLDVEHLLHAPHVGVPPRLVRVDERAAARNAGAGVDDTCRRAPRSGGTRPRPAAECSCAAEMGRAMSLTTGIVGMAGAPPQDSDTARMKAQPPRSPQKPFEMVGIPRRADPEARCRRRFPPCRERPFCAAALVGSRCAALLRRPDPPPSPCRQHSRRCGWPG